MVLIRTGISTTPTRVKPLRCSTGWWPSIAVVHLRDLISPPGNSGPSPLHVLRNFSFHLLLSPRARGGQICHLVPKSIKTYQVRDCRLKILMGWSLMPDTLRSFKIYCASPSITSQLVLFLWQTVEVDPLGHVRVVGALQNFVQK